MLEQAELSRREASNLLDQFLTYGPFSSDWSAKDGLNYVRNMKEKLNAMVKRDIQLNNDLSIFGLSFPESLAVARLEAVSLEKININRNCVKILSLGSGCSRDGMAISRRMEYCLGNL